MLVGLLISFMARSLEPHANASGAGPRPLKIEFFQSGLIRVGGEPVRLNRLADRIRSSDRSADILCVWRERKVLNGRPAFDPHVPADMKRLKREMIAVRILAEAAQSLPVFDSSDAICGGGEGASLDP